MLVFMKGGTKANLLTLLRRFSAVIMKIVDIRSFIVHSHKDNWVFTKVYTDEGITGLGESSVEGRETSVIAAIDQLKPYLIGLDPFDSEKHHYNMFRDAYWGSGAILCGALSAIDGALWDIKGKALGVPVYQLLGGVFRKKVRLYANRWFFGANSPEELAEKAIDIVEKGFTALKWDPFGKAEREISLSQMKNCMAEIEAVYKAVGDRATIIIEGHGRFNVSTAITIANELKPFKPMFFEEPIMPENIDALAEVRAKSPVPIAAGERFYSLYDFRYAIDKKAVDFIQPDLRVTGGITETKKIASIAEGSFIQVAPHNIHGLVGTAMSMHIMTTIPNGSILEYSVEDVPWKKEIFDNLFPAEKGYLTLPDRPGLGIELDEQAALRYPHKPMSLIDLMFENT